MKLHPKEEVIKRRRRVSVNKLNNAFRVLLFEIYFKIYGQTIDILISCFDGCYQL